MTKALTLKRAAKVSVWLVAATALLFVGPRFADYLIFRPGASTAVRWLGISISVAAILPWLAYVAWGLSIADEYDRRTLVVGTAVAFALAILFSIATQLMADARLVSVVITINLPIAFLLWVVGLGLSALYFKMRGG